MKKIAVLIALLLISFSAIGQSVNLKDRSVAGSLPRPVYNSEGEGVVVVAITVDQYGKVIKAVPGAEGTTITDDKLWDDARKAAIESHFSSSTDSVPVTGTITYVFSSNNSESTNTGSLKETVPPEVIDEDALKFLGIPIDGSEEHMITKLIEKGFTRLHNYDEYLVGQFNGEPVKVFVHTYHNKVDRIIVEFDKVPEMDQKEHYNHLLTMLNNSEKYEAIAPCDPIPEDELLYFSEGYQAHFNYNTDGEVWLMINDRTGYRVALYYDNLKNRPHGEDL